LCDGAQMANFWRFLRPVFSASRMLKARRNKKASIR